MMRTLRAQLLNWLVLSTAALCLSGCTTLQYRQVQNDFERAVQEDNLRSQSPFIDWYRRVADSLTPAYIADLDPKLRPNAWTLRAVSYWRCGEFALAKQSAEQGLKEPALRPYSRDDVVLTMIPGLIIDQEMCVEFKHTDSKAPARKVEELYAPGFKLALAKLDEAHLKIREPTPESVAHYWHYHRWRILQNWSIIIAAIIAEDPEKKLAAQLGANEQAEKTLGKPLTAAIAEEEAALPKDHPLAKLLQLQKQEKVVK